MTDSGDKPASIWPTTRQELLASTQLHGGPSKFVRYRPTIAIILRSKQIPRDDVDDLTSELLIKLNTSVIERYDPQRGRFRSYFRRVIDNHVLDYYRRRQRDHALRERWQESRREPASQGADELELLIARGSELFQEFLASEPVERQRQRNAEALYKWVVEGDRQRALAAYFCVSERQVRKLLTRAVERFAAWVEACFHPEDYEALRRHGHAIAACEERLAAFVSALPDNEQADGRLLLDWIVERLDPSELAAERGVPAEGLQTRLDGLWQRFVEQSRSAGSEQEQALQKLFTHISKEKRRTLLALLGACREG